MRATGVFMLLHERMPKKYTAYRDTGFIPSLQQPEKVDQLVELLCTPPHSSKRKLRAKKFPPHPMTFACAQHILTDMFVFQK